MRFVYREINEVIKVKKLVFLCCAIFTMIMLSNCSEKSASFETQEQARQQVLDNAEFNAKAYRNSTAPDATIKMRGDSTVGPKCITGDGWVSVDLVNKDTGATLEKLKCSSVSATIGCMTDKDFKERKTYASQDGVCNKELPFPLPKIAK